MDARQTAIRTLNAYVKASDYKINSELLTKALEDGRKAINEAKVTEADTDGTKLAAAIAKALREAEDAVDEILSDKEIETKLTELNTSIDTWANVDIATKNVKNDEKNGKYIDVPEIKQAIADAKAAAIKKENYVAEDFTTGREEPADSVSLFVEATNSIKKVLREYAVKVLDEVYNAKASKDTDKVLRGSVYNTLMEKLTDDESRTYVNTAGTIIGVINDELMADASYKTLAEQKVTYKGLIDSNLNTKYGKDFGTTNPNGHGSTIKTNLQALITAINPESASVDQYSKVALISNVAEEAKKSIDKATNTAEMVAIQEQAKIDELKELKEFIDNVRDEFAKQDNPTRFALVGDNITEIDESLAKEDISVDDLITAFELMLDHLTEVEPE